MSLRVALVGNPNCGKTTLFNALTGSRQYVGNWPGVTVEKKEGKVRGVNGEVAVIDLPGTYSLSPYTLEERIARDFLLQESPDAIINIVDATNLERNLYLTVQLMEMGLPVVVALNMMDELEAKGTKIDVDRLSRALGLTVVPMVATQGKGISQLLNALVGLPTQTAQRTVKFHPNDEQWIAQAEAVVASSGESNNLPPRWVAIKLLEGDPDVLQTQTDTADAVSAIRTQWADSTGQDSESLLADARYQVISGIVSTAVRKTPMASSSTLSDRIDRVLTNRVLAIPIFLLIMWSMFQITFGRLGSWTIDTIDLLWNGTLHDWVLRSLEQAGAADWLISLIGDGIIGGLGSMLVFVGQVMILFFLLALLEDSGYMARVAFIMDRMLRKMGLSGKAFIPMLLGFGCNVPAIMATRTLESEKDRRLSIMINPFMSCSARLPIYALFAGTFFAAHSGLVVFSLYLLGMLVAIIAGIVLRRTVFKGEAAPLILEMPPYRWPTLHGLSLHMWERGREFVKKAGTVIFAAAVFIWFLQSYTPALQPIGQLLVGWHEGQPVAVSLPADAEWEGEEVIAAIAQYGLEVEETEDEDTGELLITSPELVPNIGESMLGGMGRFISPVFQPLGFANPDDPVNGWKPAAATLTGVVAKEVVVATLGQLYAVGSEEDENSTELASALHGSFTPLSAYSFMVFCLLYMPCIAALGVIKREMNSWRWTLATLAFSTGVAYLVSLLVFQVGSMLGLS